LDFEGGIWFGGDVFVDEDEERVDVLVDQSCILELRCLEVRSKQSVVEGVERT
jgi:hypothetical protein